MHTMIDGRFKDGGSPNIQRLLSNFHSHLTPQPRIRQVYVDAMPHSSSKYHVSTIVYVWAWLWAFLIDKSVRFGFRFWGWCVRWGLAVLSYLLEPNSYAINVIDIQCIPSRFVKYAYHYILYE
jgi:hypothetical protein